MGDQQNSDVGTTYLVIRARGAGWTEGAALREQQGWNEHAVFMEGLHRDGFVHLGGPLVDNGTVALLVIASSEAEIRERLGADPWSAADILRIDRVEQWNLLLGKLPAA